MSCSVSEICSTNVCGAHLTIFLFVYRCTVFTMKDLSCWLSPLPPSGVLQVSVSCGIPDFRSRDGIYARLAVDFPDLPDPQAMFDIEYFQRDPRPFFKFAKVCIMSTGSFHTNWMMECASYSHHTTYFNLLLKKKIYIWIS